jgi:hypothetical protein
MFFFSGFRAAVNTGTSNSIQVQKGGQSLSKYLVSCKQNYTYMPHAAKALKFYNRNTDILQALYIMGSIAQDTYKVLA